MNLEKDRKVVLMIPHSDDELIAMMSILSRHPNPKNIYCITIVNEPIIQNLVNGYAPELSYGTQQINELVKFFDVPERNCIRVHKTLDIVENCFTALNLIDPDEVYCPTLRDGHDDHQMMYHITKRIQKKLEYKVYGWVVHVAKEERPKPDYVVKLDEMEKRWKEELRERIYPGKVDVPQFFEELFGEREEFYNA